MYLFKTGILNNKYESGSKQGWGYEDNWDRMPAYKASQFRIRGRGEGENNGRFFTKETSIVSTNIATNSVETE